MKVKLKKTMLKVLHLYCPACGYGWYPREGVVPKVCSNCKRPVEA
jgi:hypothetical protein